MPSPSRTVLIQPPIPNTTKWSVSSVQRALDTHELGDFSLSGSLARSFGRDDRINPCITDRQNALVGADSADFELRPVQEGSPWSRRSKAAIAPLEEWYYRVITAAWLRQTLYSTITIGASLSHVRWERTARSWVPARLTLWEPENFFWSEHDQLYVARLQAGWQAIEPGDPNWVLFTPGGDASWMCGAVRPLGLPALMRNWTPRDWSRYNERHGVPIVAIKEPSGERDNGDQETFYSSVRTMGSKGILRLPQGDSEQSSYGAELLEPRGRSHDSFDKFLDKLNTAIAICLKGQNLTTEVQGGAYSSTAWHMRVRKDYAEGDAVMLADTIREQLIKPWGRYNVSSWNDEIAPWPFWNLEIPEDDQAVADTLLKGAQALEILVRLQGVNADVEKLMERLKIPRLKAAPKQPTTEFADPNEETDPAAPPPEQEDAGAAAE